MEATENLKLDEYDSEEIADILPALEKTFDIRFKNDDFLNVRSFGDFCEVVIGHIQQSHKEDCTSQQAFYKIRQAILITNGMDKNTILPESRLADIFPSVNRRRQVNKFQRALGVRLNFLTYPGWLTATLLIGILLSCIAFFFDWKIAVSGILLFISALYIAEKTAKELELETVKDLTGKAVLEHYTTIRSIPYTVNKKEVPGIIRDIFHAQLYIDKQFLTDDALFSWAK